MHHLPDIAEPPLISVLIVTNGRAPHLKSCLLGWSQVATLGVNLFVCGPREALRPFDLPSASVIDHPVSEGEGMFFGINAKTHLAGASVPGHYY